MKLVQRLREECVPKKWLPVFEVRFVQQQCGSSARFRVPLLPGMEGRLRFYSMPPSTRSDRGN